MLHVLEGHTLAESLPGWQLVLVLLLSNRLLQRLIVLPSLSQNLADDGGLSFAVFATTELVQDRQQEDDFVPLIQQEICVVLNIHQHLVVLSQTCIDLVVVFDLSSFEIFFVSFDLAIEHMPLELILLVVLD